MINSVFNYTGNKFNLLEQILPLFDYSKQNFIDLFTGGGSVYLNILDKYDNILINDIITDLIELHKQLANNPIDIVNKTKSLLTWDKNDKDKYLELRANYNKENTPEKLWALMLSCTNNMMRFNKKFEFNQTHGKRTWNSNTNKKVEDFVNHLYEYKHKIQYTSENFYRIKPTKPSMVYLDPPYGRIRCDDGSIRNKQISEAGYNSFWLLEHDKKLYEYVHYLNKIQCSFMLSGVLEHNGKVCWILDKLISDGFEYKILNFNYNIVSKKGDKNTKEIIIKNY